MSDFEWYQCPCGRNHPAGVECAICRKAKSALSRCPFCGSSKVYVRFYNQPSVVCEDCLCMGPAAQRLVKDPDNKAQCEQEAILRWNKRVDYSHKVTLAMESSAPEIDTSKWEVCDVCGWPHNPGACQKPKGKA